MRIKLMKKLVALKSNNYTSDTCVKLSGAGDDDDAVKLCGTGQPTDHQLAQYVDCVR